jgi:hypothetical protein
MHSYLKLTILHINLHLFTSNHRCLGIQRLLIPIDGQGIKELDEIIVFFAKSMLLYDTPKQLTLVPSDFDS